MGILINIVLKIIISILCLIMWYINMVIVFLMWDGKYMVTTNLIDIIWSENNK